MSTTYDSSSPGRGRRWNSERRPRSSCHAPPRTKIRPTTPAAGSSRDTDASARPTTSSTRPVRIEYQPALSTPFDNSAEASLRRDVMDQESSDGSPAERDIFGFRRRPTGLSTLGVDGRLGRPYRFSISILFFDTPEGEPMPRLHTWLRWVRVTAAFIFIAALCLAVALVVIAFIPGSPVTQALPAGALSGLHQVGGVTTGVAVDSSGWVPFTVHDPSLTERLLYMLTQVPGLLLVAEIARRMAKLLRAAEASDPFTLDNVRALTTIGQLTALAGLGTWGVEPGSAGGAVREDADLAAHLPAPPHTARMAGRRTDL